MKVAVIGAGLAGCAAAYFLKRSGADVIVYEAGEVIAPGASGNDLGLYNPRLSAFESAESLFYSAAFDLALSVFPEFEDIDWVQCGALHLMTDDKREKRFRHAAENWGREDMAIVDAAQASAITGVDLAYEALYLRQAGCVSPRKLCAALASGIDIKFNEKVEDLRALDADAVVLANGLGALEFADLPLKGVRGQITKVKATAVSERVRAALCYGGYFTPAQNGQHFTGATFQRWLDHTDILAEDDDYNIGQLQDVAPGLAEGLEVTGQRAGMRTTSPDHFPVIGQLEDGLYVSAAHGSHGILSSLAGGRLLAGMIMNKPLSLAVDSVKALCPSRFIRDKNTA